MSITNTMRLSIEAKSQNEAFARSVVGAFFAQLNPTLEQVEDLKTAVSEAVTNCIVHAYCGTQQGQIDLECTIDEDKITTRIIDYGNGIPDVQQAMQPFFSTVTTGERSGMGFAVMQAFCDKVEVTSSKGKTTVELTKKV